MNTSEAPLLTDAELKLLQALIYQECGMHFDERRTHFLQDRLQRRLKECQLDSFYSYYRLLLSQQGKNELAKLLENLTVNETSFFRNKPSWNCSSGMRWKILFVASTNGATTACASGARDAPPDRNRTPW